MKANSSGKPSSLSAKPGPLSHPPDSIHRGSKALDGVRPRVGKRSGMSPQLNALTSALRDYCSANVLEEKVVLAPSRRVGFQWLDAAARSGQPVLNARVETPTGMALALAAPEMDRLGLRLLSGVRLELAVDGIASALFDARGRRAYLSGIAPSPGLTRALTNAIRDLRLAGLTSGSINLSAFEVEEKGREVKLLLAAFEKLLADTGKADYTQTLSIASKRLANEPGSLEDVVYLVPEDMFEDMRGLERALWDAVLAERCVLLPIDKPAEAPPGVDARAMTDSMLLRWTIDPKESPAPNGDATASIHSAVGEANEARDVLRRCIAGSVPFDQVEVLHTDQATYVPLFYELATRAAPEGADDLPVTFSEGIPARYSRPGRALAAWLDWTGEGFPQRELVRMVRDGLLEVPGLRERGLSFARLAAIMRTLPVGAGLERYVPKARSALNALEARLRELEAEPPAEPDGDEGDRALAVQERERLSSRGEALQLLLNLLDALEAHAPAPDDGPGEALAKARWFLEQQARSVSKIDAYGREALVDRVGELQDCLEEAGVVRFDALAWLADLPDSVRICGQGPRPGCIHVSSIQGGGHAGRPHTFILGMDDTRFPGAGLQDPVLLDRERVALSSALPTSRARIKSKVTGFARLAARLRGDVVLSYCSRSLSDDREKFPSRLLLAANRILTGGPTALFKLSEPPGSFAPLDEAGCLDMTEWWLWRTCAAGAVEAPERIMGENFSNLARGSRRWRRGLPRSSRVMTASSPRPGRPATAPLPTDRSSRRAGSSFSRPARSSISSATCSRSSRRRSSTSTRAGGWTRRTGAPSCTRCSAISCARCRPQGGARCSSATAPGCWRYSTTLWRKRRWTGRRRPTRVSSCVNTRSCEALPRLSSSWKRTSARTTARWPASSRWACFPKAVGPSSTSRRRADCCCRTAGKCARGAGSTALTASGRATATWCETSRPVRAPGTRKTARSTAGVSCRAPSTRRWGRPLSGRG